MCLTRVNRTNCFSLLSLYKRKLLPKGKKFKFGKIKIKGHSRSCCYCCHLVSGLRITFDVGDTSSQSNTTTRARHRSRFFFGWSSCSRRLFIEPFSTNLHGGNSAVAQYRSSNCLSIRRLRVRIPTEVAVFSWKLFNW